MESQHQNTEFRNNLENFHPGNLFVLLDTGSCKPSCKKNCLHCSGPGNTQNLLAQLQ